MADINARLKRALDGPAPQHKVAGEENFQVTEGSDGQLHVKDADVTAELAEIKQTQADILARLDGTINTQVTGSNVEDGIPVKQVGRDIKIEQKKLIDSLSYRGAYSSSGIAREYFDAKLYKDFEISIMNTLKDEEGNPIPLSVGFYTNGATDIFLDDGTTALYSHHTNSNRVWNEVPGNGRLYYLSDIPITGQGDTKDKKLNTRNIWKLFKANNNTPEIVFGFVDRNQIAAEGDLTCWIEGVRN